MQSLIRGPMWNRRLGTCLKLNLGNPPGGGCSWDCVYCPARAQRRRCGFTNMDHLLEDLALSLKNSASLETVMLTGNADPTLHPQFADIVHCIRELRNRTNGKWALHCLSNGSTLDRDPVLLSVSGELDQLWLKLDCSEELLFRQLNRPSGTVRSFAEHVEKIKRLSSPAIQTMLWKCSEAGTTGNWTTENLRGLLELYEVLKPSRIYLTTIQYRKNSSRMSSVDGADLQTFALRIEELGIPVDVNESGLVGVFSG